MCDCAGGVVNDNHYLNIFTGFTPASDRTFFARWKPGSVDADWTGFIIELNTGGQTKQHDIVAGGLSGVIIVHLCTLYLMTYLRLLMLGQIVRSYHY